MYAWIDRFRARSGFNETRACVCADGCNANFNVRCVESARDATFDCVLNEMCASSNNKPINSFLCLLACEFNRPALIRHKNKKIKPALGDELRELLDRGRASFSAPKTKKSVAGEDQAAHFFQASNHSLTKHPPE